MAMITVRNLEDTVLTRLKQRAETNGRSLAAEVRQILSQASKPTLAESRARLSGFRRQHFGDRVLSDSSSLLREDRDR